MEQGVRVLVSETRAHPRVRAPYTTVQPSIAHQHRDRLQYIMRLEPFFPRYVLVLLCR